MFDMWSGRISATTHMLSVATSMCSTHCLQIPLHLSRAVALLLPIPSTFHVTVMLLYHLSALLRAVQSDRAAAAQHATQSPST
jgi:hypothetical protein